METASATIQDREVSKNFDWDKKTKELEIPCLYAAQLSGELFRSVHTQESSDLSSQSEKTWQKSADLTYQIENVIKWLWNNHVKIPERNEVYNYLIQYPDMADILPPICKSLRERFQLPAELSLEVYHDPEIEDEYLTIYVRLDHYNERIIDIIEEVCAEYEAERSERSGWLLVTTDFRPPD